eukprot:9332180-Pyramimonas_sp.AAC.1
MVEFETAYDTVEHDALWAALREQGAPHGYINILKRRYSKQGVTVLARTRNRQFEYSRGVKQGDFISSYLFVVQMEAIFRKRKARWESQIEC